MSRFVVELFGNTAVNSGESEIFLGEHAVYTDTDGRTAFTIRIDRSLIDRRVKSVTATITSADGTTSPLSSPFRLP